ncbi:glycoside hydrolase family 2 protein [Brachybacterium sp. UMB0905]|uniref:glycoside hydrolase family 2 protein n=1 Tax=Brachybacterium sp. UMB0905 TaxID=2069310 RepID=UPI000C80100D|nr:glycoside hydrolase family 2 protein [Brachybacterium sp. UMB0905]PMC75941.1 beta-mannosidase [Brachybacterium sp. UMB0905]
MPSALRRTPLDSGWSISITDGPAPFEVQDLPAEVPGTLITDLLAAGLIDDPYVDDNEHALSWTGEVGIRYRTEFSWDPAPDDEVDLVAHEVDTIAELRLNGSVIGTASNQHRLWRFRVTDALQPGRNVLEVQFTAPLAAARAFEAQHGRLPFSGNKLPYNAIRKMACNFGWDWGPVLTTSGLSGPVQLESWSAARLGTIRPQVTVRDGAQGEVRLDVPVVRAQEGPQADVRASARLTGPDGAVVAQTQLPATTDEQLILELVVEDPQLWWPRGYGEQPLYDLEVMLHSAAGDVLDSRASRIGFRSAGFVQRDDEHGRSFQAEVNGRPVLIKGANWIPEDCFPSRLTRERLAARIQDAAESGMNLLRVWGGGLYESEDFYELCDEQGILVWQDFALACAAYSEVEPMRREIEAEARHQIVRLAWHPSLIHWNGSNENLVGHRAWGWSEKIEEGVGWGLHYYDELLPGLVKELDPTRSYSPSSPFSRPGVENPQDPGSGTIHQWGVWNDPVVGDPVHYRDSTPRFAAEFGFQAPATWATISQAVTERPLDEDSPVMLSHQKAFEGQQKLRRAYRNHLPEPTSFDDFLASTQLMQARALEIGIGHYRSHWPFCGGTIMWQLNDCWPVTSWSAVDGGGRRKPLWYALRSVHAPVLWTIQPRDGGWSLCIGNDTDEDLVTTAILERRRHDGTVLHALTEPLQVPARQSAELPLPAELTIPEDPAAELLVCSSADSPHRAVHHFCADKDSALAPDALEASSTRVEGGVELRLTARSTVRDVMVFADKVDPSARCDRQLVTLLAGETATVRIRTSSADAEAFLAPEVLISVNDLLARGGPCVQEDPSPTTPTSTAPAAP